MSKNWYPVIDYLECVECANICPNGAVQYGGDQNRWVPPNGRSDDKCAGCCCGGNC